MNHPKPLFTFKWSSKDQASREFNLEETMRDFEFNPKNSLIDDGTLLIAAGNTNNPDVIRLARPPEKSEQAYEADIADYRSGLVAPQDIAMQLYVLTREVFNRAKASSDVIRNGLSDAFLMRTTGQETSYRFVVKYIPRKGTFGHPVEIDLSHTNPATFRNALVTAQKKRWCEQVNWFIREVSTEFISELPLSTTVRNRYGSDLIEQTIRQISMQGSVTRLLDAGAGLAYDTDENQKMTDRIYAGINRPLLLRIAQIWPMITWQKYGKAGEHRAAIDSAHITYGGMAPAYFPPDLFGIKTSDVRSMQEGFLRSLAASEQSKALISQSSQQYLTRIFSQLHDLQIDDASPNIKPELAGYFLGAVMVKCATSTAPFLPPPALLSGVPSFIQQLLRSIEQSSTAMNFRQKVEIVYRASAVVNEVRKISPRDRMGFTLSHATTAILNSIADLSSLDGTSSSLTSFAKEMLREHQAQIAERKVISKRVREFINSISPFEFDGKKWKFSRGNCVVLGAAPVVTATLLTEGSPDLSFEVKIAKNWTNDGGPLVSVKLSASRSAEVRLVNRSAETLEYARHMLPQLIEHSSHILSSYAAADPRIGSLIAWTFNDTDWQKIKASVQSDEAFLNLFSIWCSNESIDLAVKALAEIYDLQSTKLYGRDCLAIAIASRSESAVAAVCEFAAQKSLPQEFLQKGVQSAIDTYDKAMLLPLLKSGVALSPSQASTVLSWQDKSLDRNFDAIVSAAAMRHFINRRASNAGINSTAIKIEREKLSIL